jgi:hypothetical protein
MRLTVLSFVVFCIAFTSNSQGVIFDSLIYQNLEEYKPELEQGYASGYLPSKISYRSYCPPIMNQGQLSTCVGWATAYAQVSTQQNILMGETNFRKKSARAMDPNFIYAMIRDYGDKWCQQGTILYHAMEVLLDYGVKPYISVPWLSCNSVTKIDEFTLALAGMYAIENYKVLIDKTDLTNTLKATLYNGKVLSVGMYLTESFNSIRYGKWTPSQSESPSGRHAMCIVGYDDNKYGGAFELMNSYGTSFGDNGFVWISYNDMKRYMQEAYVIELDRSTTGFRKGDCSYGDCNNYFSRYTYKSGNVYEGEFKNGYRHGWGTLLETDGTLYIGLFSDGYLDGWSILYDPASGDYYKTYFKKGELVSASVYQGYASNEDIEQKMDDLINSLQQIIPGGVVSPNDDAYDDLMERYKPLEDERVDIK